MSLFWSLGLIMDPECHFFGHSYQISPASVTFLDTRTKFHLRMATIRTFTSTPSTSLNKKRPSSGPLLQLAIHLIEIFTHVFWQTLCCFFIHNNVHHSMRLKISRFETSTCFSFIKITNYIRFITTC